MRKARELVVPALAHPWTLRPTHARGLAAIPRHWVGLRLRRRQLDRLEKIKRPEHKIMPLLPTNG
jgi:hypothetical protein